MTEHRKRYDGTFKTKVVLKAIKRQKTIAERSSHYCVYLRQIGYLKVFAEDCFIE